MLSAEQRSIIHHMLYRLKLFLIAGIFLGYIHPSLAGTIVSAFSNQWRFRKSGDKEWMPATVPGTVHTDLFDNKKIPDPFFGTNEKDLQWIDTCNWEYELWFDAGTEIISNYHCELQFEGLD